MIRELFCAACVLLFVATPLAAQNSRQSNNIQDVFDDFEAICFNYGEHGYSVEVNFLIEEAGFRFVEKARNGSDVFSSRLVQLVIGNGVCAFGMEQLPFAMMLDWTKQWVAQKGLVFAHTTKSASGGEYWIWSGKGFYVGLQDHTFPDGAALTGLILTRGANRDQISAAPAP